MSDRSTRRASGFSLLEMVIAMALGTIVLGAAVQLYSQGVAATWTVSQRAEMQQDFRAASNMLTRDLSMAGAGLGNDVVIALPATITPVYGCDQTKCYLGAANGAAATYPKPGATPYLYGLIPGMNAGPTINSLQNDAVTVVYTDSTFYLNCYDAKVTAKTVVTFTMDVALPGCVLPSGMSTPQNVNDQVVGLTVGDLVWFTLNGTPVLAEVTGISSNVVTFAASDALNMNQTTATGLVNVALNATGTGMRILVITYYIDNSVSPSRLMRQISGHSPMPVAENVVYMKFSYDLYDAAGGTVRTDQADGGASYGLAPSQITKINIKHMSMNSSMKGAKGGYQGLDLQTSVSARDLTYSNGYPLAP
jgi:prepilin-type N-terminal cleavage/methylation domain-containing protein